MYLFFDTETTGLPKNWKAPVTDTNNWPRMIQIAWQHYNTNHQLLDEQVFIIKPENFTIPKAASDVHGITTEKALMEGHDLTTVLNIFRQKMLESEYLIAHNISFDEMVLGAEFIRKKIQRLPKKLPRIDTMQESTTFCALPGKYGDYKWPNLTELHTKLFGKGFDGAHDALADVVACANCFFELKKIGVIQK